MYYLEKIQNLNVLKSKNLNVWEFLSKNVLLGAYCVLYSVGGQGQGPVQGGGQGGHSVLGITANSAIGLLGLLLFINILRVWLAHDYDYDYVNHMYSFVGCDCSDNWREEEEEEGGGAWLWGADQEHF